MKWPFFRRGRPPTLPGAAVNDSPDLGQPLTGAVVSPASGQVPAGDPALTDDDSRPMRFPEYLELFGEKSIPVILIAVGLGIVAADDGAEVNRVAGWATPEYVGSLAFAALLIILGCLERIVKLWSARGQ